MYEFTRRYRLCSVDPVKGTYRLTGEFPRFSTSPSYVSLEDNRGNVLLHSSDPGADAARPMVAIDLSKDVELPAGSTEITLELVITDDASSKAGWARFRFESAKEIRRLDGDFPRLPLGCYQTEEPPTTMTVDTWSLTDRDSLLFAARAVEACYGDIDDAAEFVERIALDGDTIKKRPVDPAPGTGVVVLHSQRRVMVFIAGTTGLAQLAAQTEGMTLGPQEMGRDYGTMQFWERGADIVLAVMRSAGVDGTKRIVLCGHSMGGAIAYLVGARIEESHQPRHISILTFGSPRPGDARFHAYLSNAFITRAIRNYGDIVPFTCPHFDELPWLDTHVPFKTLRQMDRWIDPPSITTLHEDGRMEMGNHFRPLQQQLDLIWKQLTLEAPGYPVGEHSMHEYVRRLLIRP